MPMPEQSDTERLDRIYYCHLCGCSFLFRSDKEEHTKRSSHAEFTVFTLDGKMQQQR